MEVLLISVQINFLEFLLINLRNHENKDQGGRRPGTLRIDGNKYTFDFDLSRLLPHICALYSLFISSCGYSLLLLLIFFCRNHNCYHDYVFMLLNHHQKENHNF